MRRQRYKGRFTVYVGVRVDEATVEAVQTKAMADGFGLGDAYRQAFRLYADRTALRVPARLRINRIFSNAGARRREAA